MYKKAAISIFLAISLLVTLAIPGSAQVIIENVGTSIFPSNFMPAQGNVGALVIPVEFIDFRFQEDPVENLEAMFSGNGTDLVPSVEDYFTNASYGEMKINAEIQPVVRLDKTRSSYSGQHAQLIEDLLAVMTDRGIDLSEFDQNGDGVLDGLYIIWAGAPEASGDDWWPYSDTFYFEYKVAGIQLGSFSFLSYELLTENSVLRQYTAIHETGHQLGLTDYYADSYTSGTNAAVMMDRNEGDEDCFSKMLLGWITPQVINSSCYVTLESASVVADAALIAPQSWDGNYLSEYFMAEYVTPEANQEDQPLAAGGGVRIWHVNAVTSQWTDDITASMYRSDNSNAGPKLLSIVDPNTEWYGTSDMITEEQTGLYTGENSGISIRVDAIENGSAQLCVVYFGEEPAKPEKDEASIEEEEQTETEEDGAVENSEEPDGGQNESSMAENPAEEENVQGELEFEENAVFETEGEKKPSIGPILILILLGVLVYLVLKNDKKRKYKKRRRRKQ